MENERSYMQNEKKRYQCYMKYKQKHGLKTETSKVIKSTFIFPVEFIVVSVAYTSID